MGAGGPTARLRQFVLKVHSRCDLACDYCYVYESPDTSWQQRPVRMSDVVLRQTLHRIREHVGADTAVQVVLHGGEPLLLGVERMREVLVQIRAELGGPHRCRISVQTNGVRLDQAFAGLFVQFGVQVGISLDGGAEATARHRRFRNGRSSYPMVRRATTLMAAPSYRESFAGLLCTVDLANDPVAVFGELSALGPPAIDFLLPHATWENPPERGGRGETAYGEWLLAAFEPWYRAAPESPAGRVRVRLFAAVLDGLLGGLGVSEVAGRAAPASIVVETDGAIEQTDALKIAYHGAPATGFDVAANSFDEVLRAGEQVAPSLSGELPTGCRPCDLRDVCGGGLYAHRYRAATGFDNPSVYCTDLSHLIRGVRRRILPDLAASTGRRAS